MVLLGVTFASPGLTRAAPGRAEEQEAGLLGVRQDQAGCPEVPQTTWSLLLNHSASHLLYLALWACDESGSTEDLSLVTLVLSGTIATGCRRGG